MWHDPTPPPYPSNGNRLIHPAPSPLRTQLLDGRFTELGATRFYPVGFADDATGLEGVVDPLCDGLVLALELAMSGSGEATAGEAKGGAAAKGTAVPWPLYTAASIPG